MHSLDSGPDMAVGAKVKNLCLCHDRKMSISHYMESGFDLPFVCTFENVKYVHYLPKLGYSLVSLPFKTYPFALIFCHSHLAFPALKEILTTG